MKKLFILCVLTLIFFACGDRPYRRLERTEVERYAVAHNKKLCGLYDQYADSLVTAVHYEQIEFNAYSSEQGKDYVIWTIQREGYNGMLAINLLNNECIEILFPKE